MSQVLDSVRGRIFLVLLFFVSVAHVAGLWLYSERSNTSTSLLKDALLADRIARVARLVEDTPAPDIPALLKRVSSPVVTFTQSTYSRIGAASPEGSRPHFLEHLLSVFLQRPASDDVRVRFSLSSGKADTDVLLATINHSAHEQIDHLPDHVLAEIGSVGIASVEVRLPDGTWLHVTAPLLAVEPFSLWKVGISLAAMLAAMLPLGYWILNRLTGPLTLLAVAAERLGRDIYAPSLKEEGPREIRVAAHAFNGMQERIRRLVQDRIAIAAAIAHDLGTPVTRLHLRAEEISDATIRLPILSDLDQMRRMITETLSFARHDFAAESSEATDVTSLMHRVCDDLVDLGADVIATGPPHVVVRTKPVALHRALTNLVENAVKHGTRARVTLSETNTSVEFVVDDDGPGIPDHLKSFVFEPFRRIPHADNQADGAGLGLTTARSLVRSLGGDITLRNRAEGGLSATIQLPK